jgi:hypothetical protein
MQSDTLLAMPDLDGNLEQLGDDRRRLGLRQGGMLQRLGAQLLMQDISRGMQQQMHAIGQETGTGSAVSRQVVLQILDEILSLAARAVDVLVQRTGIQSDKRGDDKARFSPCAMTSAFNSIRQGLGHERAA